MNDSKSIFTSVTFWGVVLSIVAPLAGKYGFQFDAAGISGLANDLAGGAGALIAIYGRMRAAAPAHIVPPAQ